MPAETPGYLAAGDIYPARIVKPYLAAGSNPFKVVQADAATDTPLGVSDNRVKVMAGMVGITAPYKAAESGDPILVFGSGEQCVVEAGAAFTGGDYLISDSEGRAIPLDRAATTGVQGFVGRALETATASGQIKRCLVQPGLFPGI
jgi:hypothetical protein